MTATDNENTETPEEAPAEEASAEDTATATATAEPAAPAGPVDRSLHGVLKTLHQDQMKTWPEFNVGDLVRVHYRIVEGEKERIQVYEGNVISIRGEGYSKAFVVRRISHDVGVERIFPYHSPAIAKIEIARRGRVRRAKLYYLRHKSGKQGRIKEARRK